MVEEIIIEYQAKEVELFRKVDMENLEKEDVW